MEIRFDPPLQHWEDERLNGALRKFKKLSADTLAEYRNKSVFEKPSTLRRMKQETARKRQRRANSCTIRVVTDF